MLQDMNPNTEIWWTEETNSAMPICSCTAERVGKLEIRNPRVVLMWNRAVDKSMLGRAESAG